MQVDRIGQVADLAVERSRKRQAAAADADADAGATHHDMATAWLDGQAIADHKVVFAGGAFHAPQATCLWGEKSVEAAQAEIAREFNDRKLCKRNSDYKQIADHASVLAEDESFFAQAPIGVTTPCGFHSIGKSGRREMVPLTLAHRQQFMLAWDPDFDAEPVLLNRMLEDAFAGDSPSEQVDLVWQLMGTILFGVLPALQLVGLLLGREKSGKSTLQGVVEAAFPAAVVSAVSPAVWSREYNVAALAGKRLNLVGELSDDSPIPAAAFKNVTGGNLIEGRHPTHRPFYFKCPASHLFAGNVTPPTTDRTEAFFRRWRIVRFSNRVAEERAVPHLEDKIVLDEMPAFLALAFRGAERVLEAGTVRTTPAHDAAIAKWKGAANPVLQFLLDDDWIELDPAAADVSTSDAYVAYRGWASEVGMRNPFGRNHFLDLVESTGASLGVLRRKAHGVNVIVGVRLVSRGGGK